MFTKKRLIDATHLEAVFQNLIKSSIGTWHTPAYRNALERLQAAPTVDAVEVVRCKDCLNAQKEEPLGTLWCNGTIVKGDYFCASGERRPYRGNG